MPIINTQHPVCTFLLRHSAPDHRPNLLLDIFPGRIEPREGYTHDDVLLAILGSGVHKHAEMCAWDLLSLQHWQRAGMDGATFYHPLGRIHPGAVQISKVPFEHVSGTTPICASMDTDQIHIADRSWTRASFAHTSYPQNHQNRRNTLTTSERMSARQNATILGSIAHLIAQGHTALLPYIPALTARLAPLVLDSGALSGKSARQAGWAFGADLKDSLYELWIVRPETVGDTSRLILDTQAFDELHEDLRAPTCLQGGRAAAQALIAHAYILANVDPRMLADLDPLPAHISAHQQVALRKLRKAIDAALIAHVDPLWLKPGAKRKRVAA